MGRAVVPCPVCGRWMEARRTECAACARMGATLVGPGPELPDGTPDLAALLALIHGVFAVIFALLGWAVSRQLGTFLGGVTGAVGILFGLAGLYRTQARFGRAGRWLATAGLAVSVGSLLLLFAAALPGLRF